MCREPKVVAGALSRLSEISSGNMRSHLSWRIPLTKNLNRKRSARRLTERSIYTSFAMVSPESGAATNVVTKASGTDCTLPEIRLLEDCA